MRRVLVVLRGAIDTETIKQRCDEVSRGPSNLAVCYELPLGRNGLEDALYAQRAITELLREAWGPQAEGVAIFAATGHDGDCTDDYAREWGATEVVA